MSNAKMGTLISEKSMCTVHSCVSRERPSTVKNLSSSSPSASAGTAVAFLCAKREKVNARRSVATGPGFAALLLPKN